MNKELTKLLLNMLIKKNSGTPNLVKPVKDQNCAVEVIVEPC